MPTLVEKAPFTITTLLMASRPLGQVECAPLAPPPHPRGRSVRAGREVFFHLEEYGDALRLAIAAGELSPAPAGWTESTETRANFDLHGPRNPLAVHTPHTTRGVAARKLRSGLARGAGMPRRSGLGRGRFNVTETTQYAETMVSHAVTEWIAQRRALASKPDEAPAIDPRLERIVNNALDRPIGQQQREGGSSHRLGGDWGAADGLARLAGRRPAAPLPSPVTAG